MLGLQDCYCRCIACVSMFRCVLFTYKQPGTAVCRHFSHMMYIHTSPDCFKYGFKRMHCTLVLSLPLLLQYGQRQPQALLTLVAPQAAEQ